MCRRTREAVDDDTSINLRRFTEDGNYEIFLMV